MFLETISFQVSFDFSKMISITFGQLVLLIRFCAAEENTVMSKEIKYKMQLIGIIFAFINGNTIATTEDLQFLERVSIDFNGAVVFIHYMCSLATSHICLEERCNISSEFEIVFEESKNEKR